MKPLIWICLTLTTLAGCSKQQEPVDPIDPYQNINRKVYKFNKAFDATVSRPIAKIYKAILPPPIQDGVRNAFNNIRMLPTVANDMLQGDIKRAYFDSWRLFINTTVGIGGVLDVADKWGLAYKPNDFGLTLAKWGDPESPYVMLPFFGPSTFRDTAGMTLDYSIFSIYPYMKHNEEIYGLFALNMLQIRADLLGTEALVDEAIDEYSFVRDAYLQHRRAQFNPNSVTTDAPAAEDDGALYIDGDEDEEYYPVLSKKNPQKPKIQSVKRKIHVPLRVV